MSNGFYKAFEDRFRGSREMIKERLRAYLAFAEPFKRITTGKLKVLDIGCGRGEWIELMIESGFDAYGIDLDEGMLADCYEKSLPAKKGDAISFIKALENDSHIIVSAFQVVEHIFFEDLNGLVKEALRILIPGGLLIMETPNPENIIVATKNFYLDPTHKRPIPPELLSFLPEYHGFERVKVLRLRESINISKDDRHNLYNVINGVSPDYSVIAQKRAPCEILVMFDKEFEEEYSFGLEALATQYDRSVSLAMKKIEGKNVMAESGLNRAGTDTARVEAAVNRLEAELMAAKEKIEVLSHQTGLLKSDLVQERGEKDQFYAELTEARNQIAQLHESNHKWWSIADQESKTLKVIYASWSWKITWPLRKLSGTIKWIFKLPVLLVRWIVHLADRFVSWIIVKVMAFAINKNNIRPKLLAHVNKYPRLKARLYIIGQKRGLFDKAPIPQNGLEQGRQKYAVADVNIDILSPRAREIYFDLKQAIELRQKEN